MKGSQITALVGCTLGLVIIGFGPSCAAAEIDAQTQARIARFEQGTATIDVSRYPQAIQDSYRVYTKECTACHKLSRSINSDYALPGEWERYIKRMLDQSAWKLQNTQKIFEFLVYDSSIRKQDLIEAKLAHATEQDRKAEEARIKAIREKYDHPALRAH